MTRAAGGGLTATAGDDGALRLATSREGSAASLQVVSADPALGLTDTTTTAHGTDGVVELDGVATTFTDLGPGSTVTLAGAGTDAVQLSLAGGLRAGTATLADLGVAAGSNIAQVASAATSSSLGLSGTTVKVGDAAYKLQLTSSTRRRVRRHGLGRRVRGERPRRPRRAADPPTPSCASAPARAPSTSARRART